MLGAELEVMKWLFLHSQVWYPYHISNLIRTITNIHNLVRTLWILTSAIIHTSPIRKIREKPTCTFLNTEIVPLKIGLKTRVMYTICFQPTLKAMYRICSLRLLFKSYSYFSIFPIKACSVYLLWVCVLVCACVWSNLLGYVNETKNLSIK